MSITIELRELPARIEEALAIITAGGEVFLTDGAAPRARLVPCGEPGPRVPGLHAGAFVPEPDFDAPLPETYWAGQS